MFLKYCWYTRLLNILRQFTISAYIPTLTAISDAKVRYIQSSIERKKTTKRECEIMQLLIPVWGNTWRWSWRASKYELNQRKQRRAGQSDFRPAIKKHWLTRSTAFSSATAKWSGLHVTYIGDGNKTGHSGFAEKNVHSWSF